MPFSKSKHFLQTIAPHIIQVSAGLAIPPQTVQIAVFLISNLHKGSVY